MKIKGEIPVLMDGRRVGTAREVSWDDGSRTDAPPTKWVRHRPAPARPMNRHERRRAAALARRDG
ncbi:hypothetical protein [Sorangium sp. So ce388]|uniref:hypothetical protein n=1 Tax=Sorangium sp. So ce388 TaxID=3133309 RepID=UPI003F5B888B